MDAKPHRPAQRLRVSDENAIPSALLPKTLHHRNKSSPALSTAAQAGAMKAAARRTAFGDLSNTANAMRPIRDDSVIGAKAASLSLKENLPPIQEKRQSNFQKPAQRPMSVIGLRNILNDAAKIPVQKQPLGEIKPLPLNSQAPLHKITTKRSTTVFKDQPPSNPPQEKIVIEQRPIPVTNNIHRSLPPVPLKQTSSVEVVSRPQISEVYSDAVETAVDPALIKLPCSNDDLYPTTSELALNTLTNDGENKEPEVLPSHVQPISPKITTNHYISKVPLIDRAERLVTTLHSQPEVVNKHPLPPLSEPEEYWEEEEAAEMYDEEGYITARSSKSRGENTTGLGTTILFPKQTQKTKREVAMSKQLIEGSKTVEELEDEAWDTTMVAEYSEEIFDYMKELEVKMLPNAHYMDNQAEIQWSMRAVLIDWLVQVHHRFNLLPETLFLTVNYIDRFLSAKVVSLNKLQLVGATAIFIAAKYEEIDCPSVQEVQFMVDGGYTIDEILKAERFMLSMLQFELGWPGPMSFLRRISKADDYDLETRTLAKYFLEVSVMDERFIGSPPSFIAAGAHCLARMMLRKGSWSPSHVYYSTYTYSQLFSLIMLMIECCEDPRRHHAAVFDKYTDKRFKRASLFAEGEMRRGFQPLHITNSFPLGNQAILSYTHTPLPPELWCKA